MSTTGGNVKEALAAILEESSVVIPAATLRSRWKKFTSNVWTKINGPHDDEEVDEDLALFDRSQMKDKSAGLTSQSTQKYLQSVANARDDNNRGMTRKEMICFISDIENVSIKKAENHYDHLIPSKQLPDLKRNGRVVSAQPTTTNRTTVTTTKLLRTHNTLAQGTLLN